MLAALIPVFALAGSVVGQVPWFEPFPAHRVIANVYHVGSKDLASYLITTPEGHILINSGFEQTVPLIRAGVESLGFKMGDIKILLASHAHSDHVAGHALLRDLTGARVYVMRGDDAVIASGGAGQYFYTRSRWKPCPVDRVLEDGQEVTLGGVTLVARRTPGHTRGCTTWTWRVEDGGKSYNVVVIGSPNVNPGYQLAGNTDYPEIADDFARTFQILKSLPCDVFLGAHGGYYGMVEKYQRVKEGAATNPFIDPEGYRAYVALKEKAFRDTLAAQQAARAAKGAAAAAPAARRPNIVLVMPDDVGYGDFACNGNPIIRTPNVDAFARQSIRLTDFHVSPTCAPTRSALMTGRHEFKSGVTHTIMERERMSLKATTLAQVLKSAGYATGIFGKWHLGDEDAYQPERRGFDEVFIHGAGGIGQSYPGSCGDAPGNSYVNPALLHNGVFEKTQGYCTDLFFGQALKWIDAQRKKEAPFFAYITPNAAHAPLDCPDEYANRYRGKVPENVARFFGMIENIDDNFGTLLEKLRAWGLEENTLVIFMTDNGGTAGVRIFNADMHGAKGTAYQGGTRVPSFWRWPAGFSGGVDVGALTAHIDIFPTLAEVAGATTRLSDEVRKQVEGRSLLPLLKDPKADWPDRFFVTHVGRWPKGEAEQSKYARCSIRDSRFTLVDNTALYDLKDDPGETKNVLDQHPDEVARLRAAYDRWWQEVLPCLENEAVVGPKINPFKERYWKQFGGGPGGEARDPK
jgi:arylsulfatase